MIALNLNVVCLSKPNQSFETSDKLAGSPPCEYTHEEAHSKRLKYHRAFIFA